MPLSHLAAVELQLVMHCCDQPSLLALARCSRFTYACAASEFAWSRMPPFIADSSDPHVGQQLASCLLRYCDVQLVWSLRPGFRQRPNVDLADLRALQSVPRLRLLDARCRSIEDSPLSRSWTMLLSMPALRQMRGLMLSYTRGDVRLGELLASHAPLLDSLHIEVRASMLPWGYLDGIGRLPSLRSLRLEDSASPLECGLMHVAECAQLTSLDLSNTLDSAWAGLLQSRHLQRVQHLTIRSACALHGHGAQHPPSPIPWAGCFSNLRALTSLTLVDCSGVNSVLQGLLAHSAALRSLLVRVSEVGDAAAWEADVGSTLPAPALMLQLVQQRPELEAELYIETQDPSLRHEWDEDEDALVRWALEVRGQYSPMLLGGSQRLRLTWTEPEEGQEDAEMLD